MTESRVLLEVAVATVDDARVAHAERADRLELCSALELGGLTPSVGLLEEVVGATLLPVVVMIRPRAGAFIYSDGEFTTMLRDVDAAFEHGAAGVVFGILKSGGGIDVERTKVMVERVAGRGDAVFHRAFDVLGDQMAGLDRLMELGLTRVLTSGGQATAIEGADTIQQLVERSAGRIDVLAGAGVTPWNVTRLVQKTGVGQVHGTFSEKREDLYPATSPVKLRETRAALARL